MRPLFLSPCHPLTLSPCRIFLCTVPHIATIPIATPFCQAGLAGYSDRAMRLVARRRGCAYAVTEALLDTILLAGGLGLKKSIDINDEDHPIAGQIIGSEPAQMAAAAQILAARGYDVIDLNFACPVKKVKNKARGGHMLQDPARGIAILQAVRDAVPANIPTTVSLRRAFDESPESTDRFDQLIETAWRLGYSAVRVHGRTVEQKYHGRANWDVLRDLRRRYPDKTLLGSGDVFTAEDAVAMLQQTGVDIVWIARGAIGNPWIFRHAAALLSNCQLPIADYRLQEKTSPGPASAFPIGNRQLAIGNILPPSIADQRDALVEHFALSMQIHGEQLAGRRMRKMGIKYSRFHPHAAEVKRDFITVHSLRDWQSALDRWYATDAPGVWPNPAAADEVNVTED